MTILLDFLENINIVASHKDMMNINGNLYIVKEADEKEILKQIDEIEKIIEEPKK